MSLNIQKDIIICPIYVLPYSLVVIMDTEEIKERLDRLENRTKMNFFEIEKRFSQLAVPSGNEEIEKLKDRIQELEDLQMYLELENIKIKEKISDTGPYSSPDLDQRVKHMEEKMSGTQHVVVHDKKIPENVSRQIDELRSELGRMGSSRELREAINLMEKRMDATENMMEHLGELIKSSEQVSLSKGLDEIRRARKEIESVMKAKDDIMSRFNQMSSGIERISGLVSSMEAMEQKIQKDIAVLEDMKTDVEDHPYESMPEIMQRITLIEEKMKSDMQQSQVLRSRINDIYNRFREHDDAGKNINEELKGTLEKLEHDMEARAHEFLSENLRRFAKTLDEKIPQLLSESYLTQKIVDAQSSIAPIQRQINELKVKMDSIEKRIVGIHSYMPVVVE